MYQRKCFGLRNDDGAQTMLLASLMAVAVSGFVPDWNVRRPINASKGSHRFTDSCGTAATIPSSPEGHLRMGFGERPDRGHAIGSRREVNGAAGERITHAAAAGARHR